MTAVIDEAMVSADDIATVRATIVQLTGEIQDIDAQLGARDRTTPDGERLTEHEYWSWRQRAVYAKTAKVKELRELKEALRLYQQERMDEHRTQHSAVVVGGELGAAVTGIMRRAEGLQGAVQHLAETCPDDAAVCELATWIDEALEDMGALLRDRGWVAG